MPISVTCTCGHRLRVDDSAAGKDGTCPVCSQPLKLEGKTVAPYDVFISYSSKDKTIADAAVAVLEQRGLRCWVAPRDIVAGKEWSESIIEWIEQSQMMVLIFSQHSNQSQQVVREVERAVAKGLAIIPFRIEDIPASKSMEYFISSRHWLDAWNPPFEQHLNKLADMSGHLLDQAPPPGTSSEGQSVSRKLSAASGTLLARDQRMWLLLVAAAAVLLAALIVGGAMWGFRERVAPEGMIALKAEAETIARQVQGYAPTQGFDQQQREIQRVLTEGTDLFGSKQFPKAEAAYRRVIDSANKLQELQSQREAADVAAKKVKESKSSAESARAKDRAPAEWTSADKHETEAHRFYSAGEFVAAAKEWDLAATKWKEAMAQAEKSGRPEMKALAFWLGFAVKNANLYEQLRPKASGDGGPRPSFGRTGPPLTAFPAARAASDWPPFKETVDNGIEILESQCRPNLGLDDALFERYFKTSEVGVRDAVMTEMFEQLAEKHGDQVEKAARLGVNLALLRVACYRAGVGSQGTRMTRGQAVGLQSLANRGVPADVAEGADDLPRSAEKAIERAYQCGASQELVDEIKKIRREWDSVHDGFLHGGWARDSASDMIQIHADSLIIKHFRTVEVATAYFASAKPATPPAAIAPDPATAAAVETLTKNAAQITFDLDRADRPPISLGFRLQGASSKAGAAHFEQVLPEVRKLTTLRALNLGHTGVTDEQLGQLDALVELEKLHLTRAALTPQGLAHLKQYPKLTNLGLNSVPVDDEGAKILGELVQLQELDLYGTSVSDKSIDELAKLTSLKSLAIGKTKITSEGLAKLKQALPKTEIDGD